MRVYPVLSRWVRLPRIASILALLLVSATAADAAASHRCGRQLVANPANPNGYGLIIDRLNVRGVTCSAAGRVAAKAETRRSLGGWTCRTNTTPERCRRGAASFTYVFGGDAG